VRSTEREGLKLDYRETKGMKTIVEEHGLGYRRDFGRRDDRNCTVETWRNP